MADDTAQAIREEQAAADAWFAAQALCVMAATDKAMVEPNAAHRVDTLSSLVRLRYGEPSLARRRDELLNLLRAGDEIAASA